MVPSEQTIELENTGKVRDASCVVSCALVFAFA
jgi:hypothetical protein